MGTTEQGGPAADGTVRNAEVRDTALAAELRALLSDLRDLVRDVDAAEAANREAIERVAPRHRESARNLVHYVELRRHDIRGLQHRLSRFGLSSIGRTEAHVRPNLQVVASALGILAGDTREPLADPDAMSYGPRTLAANAVALLGPQPENRASRIMVTFPPEAAADPGLVEDMLANGMDIARINCAHDGAQAWDAMIANIRAAEKSLAAKSSPGARRPACRIAMDLAGPKLRTGPLEGGPQVVKVRPRRSATGQVLEPGRFLLAAGTPEETEPGLPRIEVGDADWLARLVPGDLVDFTDARGSRRTARVEESDGSGAVCATERTVYFVPGLVLAASGRQTMVGALPARPQAHTVRTGDRIVLTRSMEPAPVVPGGPHRIGCSLPQAFDDAVPGDRVFLDDGKIGGVIEETRDGEIVVEVTTAGAAGVKLRAEKGINFPDTALGIPALTAEDLEALDYVVAHADIVDYSFVRSADDVAELLRQLQLRGRPDLDIVLKIETVEAFRNLPQILLEAMRSEDIGVMIARGDLAVEAGFERLAEIQEEILWLCEAAHVPVIWATQVLDTMARTGLPSRAEVTDAAMSDRAECVMLNKGPFIGEAIGFLSDILGRMQDHQAKKRTLLRKLQSWDLDPN